MPYITGDRREAVDSFLKLVHAHVDGDTATTICTLAQSAPEDCGELNYALTLTAIGNNRLQFGQLDARLRAIGTAYLMAKPLRYQRINDLIGAAHGAAMELDRRRPGAKKFEVVTLIYMARTLYAEMGVAYELKKIAENGDIDFGESADAAMVRAKQERKS